MLIRRAEVRDEGIVDVRISGQRIEAIGHFEPLGGEQVMDARGGSLLPGLHDHHIHLLATAAEAASIRCDRASVGTAEGLAAALARPGRGWIRGILYDEGIAGFLDADRLEEMVPDRPVRVQDRTGRMWFLNHRAIELLLEFATPPSGLERIDGRWTGRLFDSDSWLRRALASHPPCLFETGRRLLAHGITGLTDLTPGNGAEELAHFARERARGGLPQHCLIGGTASLADCTFTPGLDLGPLKFHLHEAGLPDFDQSVLLVRLARDQDRAAAFHCVTEIELVFALALIREAATGGRARIEHGAVITDPLAAEIARLGCVVVTQPHFIAERGERYLSDVDPADRPWLYRLSGLVHHGIDLAGGSDSPWGSTDPWLSMRSAVSRRTATGALIGAAEALSPEEALALYLKDPHEPDRERTVRAGAPADLCLLDRSWKSARSRLMASDVKATFLAGSVVYERVDEAPFERSRSVDAAARQDQQIGAATADPPAYR